MDLTVGRSEKELHATRRLHICQHLRIARVVVRVPECKRREAARRSIVLHFRADRAVRRRPKRCPIIPEPVHLHHLHELPTRCIDPLVNVVHGHRYQAGGAEHHLGVHHGARVRPALRFIVHSNALGAVVDQATKTVAARCVASIPLRRRQGCPLTCLAPGADIAREHDGQLQCDVGIACHIHLCKRTQPVVGQPGEGRVVCRVLCLIGELQVEVNRGVAREHRAHTHIPHLRRRP